MLRAPCALWTTLALAVPLGCTSGASVVGGAPTGADGGIDELRAQAEATHPCDVRFPKGPLASQAQAPLQGRFVHDARVEALLAGAPSLPFTGGPEGITSALLVDLNGDGRTDMVFNDQRDYTGGAQQDSRSWVLWQGETGGLRAPEPLGDLRSCSLAADLDGDGRPDLVCNSLAGLVVRWNGPGGFDAGAQLAIPLAVPVIAVTAWDIDDDGALDLVFAAWGGATRVFRNLRGRAFEDATERWSLDANGLAWCAAFVDFDGDGRRELYIPGEGEQHENRAIRTAVSSATMEPRLERFAPTEAVCDREGHFGTSGASPMGVAVGDIDRDGRAELVLATIMPPRVLTRRAAPPYNWNDVTERVRVAAATTTTGNFLVPWSPTLWDMDHDGWLDLWFATGDDIGFAMGENRGLSALMAYRGAPGGTFSEASTALGLDAPGQFCSVHLGDLDDDGDLDVVAGRFGAPPRVFENRLAPASRHVIVALRGSVSNPEGRGATVVAGPRAHPVGGSFPPWAAPQPVLDVALGADPMTDRLVVTWPSGCEQVVAGPFTERRVTVTEPAWLTLSPATYHHRAGSDDLITVTVHPALLAPRAASPGRVEIDDVAGAARWEGEVTAAADGAFQRVLRAGMDRGSVAIRVRVDGRELPARPRVWFD